MNKELKVRLRRYKQWKLIHKWIFGTAAFSLIMCILTAPLHNTILSCFLGFYGFFGLFIGGIGGFDEF